MPNTRWLIASGMAPGSGLHAGRHPGQDGRARCTRAGAAATRRRSHEVRELPGPAGSEADGAARAQPAPAAGGRYTVYATNHGGRESIEVFEIDAGGAAPTATWVGCVLLPKGMAANSVAAFTDRTLLATVLIMPGKTFEDAFARKNTGAVFAWKPGEPTFQMLPGTELSANNGIETSPDDQEFYVASTTTKRIYAFARAKPGVAAADGAAQGGGPGQRAVDR